MKKFLRNILSAILSRAFVLSRVQGRNGEIALTFDDGPHPVNTKKLLEILAGQEIKATFFLSGSEIVRYPDLVDAIAAQGHEIGNHSFYHRKMSEIGYAAYAGEVCKTSELLEKTLKVPVARFRPPYGELSGLVIWFIIRHALRYTGWSFDSRDSFLKTSRELAESLQRSSIASGDILLFHEDYQITVDAMPEIINDLKSRGFRFVRISELVETKA
jgi:peptidoglycan/xylan/chitin deacetylase (PgdA/CDA1 family)